MDIGTAELYVILFFIVIAFIGVLLSRNQQPKKQKSIRFVLFGVTSIFLLAGLLTPPDLISNLIIAIPTIIIFSIILIIKSRRKR